MHDQQDQHSPTTPPQPPTPVDAELVARQRAEHSARMSRLWEDPEWRENITAKMKAQRSTARAKRKLRDSLLDAARERTRKTGVAPQWSPKKVAALEPTGKWLHYDSVRQCAAHYGIKESNMRAILKFGRTWHGIKFVLAV